tara:strand:- start:1004 stop:1264 length:261 start_codon:yes stop_codon:yes gene_type:complete
LTSRQHLNAIKLRKDVCLLFIYTTLAVVEFLMFDTLINCTTLATIIVLFGVIFSYLNKTIYMKIAISWLVFANISKSTIKKSYIYA